VQPEAMARFGTRSIASPPAIRMFNEDYHLQQVHRQMLRFQDDLGGSHAHGRHGMFEYP